MQYIRYALNGKASYGIRKDNMVFPITGNIFEEYTVCKQGVPLSGIAVLPPTVPSKIVAVGLNYKGHIKEMNKAVPTTPCLFLKPSSAIIGHEDTIILPPMSKQVDYEAELAIVIKRKAKNIMPANVPAYLLGYTLLNDVTARDLQTVDSQWTRAKGFDTFAPLGPFITDEINPGNTKIRLLKNDKVMQESNTSDFIFPVFELIAFISQVMTLYPGDVVTTGTPSGIGPMDDGDKIEVEMCGVMKLTNFVKRLDK